MAQSIGSWESTPHLNESPPAHFSVYQGDEPLLPGLDCGPERLIWVPYVTLHQTVAERLSGRNSSGQRSDHA